MPLIQFQTNFKPTRFLDHNGFQNSYLSKQRPNFEEKKTNKKTNGRFSNLKKGRQETDLKR